MEMEELPAKAKEVMDKAENDYENWKEKVESVLQKAVFTHDKTTATVIYEYLKKKLLDVGAIISNLEGHIMPKALAAEVKNVMRPTSTPSDNFSQRPPTATIQPQNQHRPAGNPTNPFVGARTFLTPSVPRPRPILPSQAWQTVARKPNFASAQTVDTPGQLSEDDDVDGDYEGEKDSRISDDDSSSFESTIVPTKVFLLNLARSSDSQSIARYFSKYGPVVDVKIIRFSDGVSRGVGSIEFKYVETAKNVLANMNDTHMIDGRPVSCRPFRPKDPSEKNGPKPWERFQIFLGGIPSFYTEEQVKADLAGKVTVRDIRMRAERGYAYLDLASEKDVDYLLKLGRVKMGEKLVQCKLNEQRH